MTVGLMSTYFFFSWWAIGTPLAYQIGNNSFPYSNSILCIAIFFFYFLCRLLIIMIIIMFSISIAQISIWTGSNTVLQEINYLQLLFTNQIICWYWMREKNRSTREKTSHGRVENQRTQSTYDTECGNQTRATLVVETKCSHH